MPSFPASVRPVVVVSDALEYGDDGVAIAMLLGHAGVALRLVIATSGNVWADAAGENLRRLLARLGRPEIAVETELPSPAQRRRLDAFAALSLASRPRGFVGAMAQPLPPGLPHDSPALHALLAAIEKTDGLDLVLIAPAGVVARGLVEAPRTMARIERIFMMGGALNVAGNATDTAEFNVWFDPESAEAVLASDIPLTLVPLDATTGMGHDLGPAAIDKRAPAAAYLADCLAADPRRPRPMWDEVLVAAMLMPEAVVRREALKLTVETTAGPRYGALAPLPNNALRRAVDVVLEVDRTVTAQLVFNLIAGSRG